MNKCEELKALIAASQSQIPTNVTATEYDNLYQERKIDRHNLGVMAVRLLPQFIAVAEAAKDIISKNDLHWSDTIEHRIEREKILKNALEPLTKDADK